MREMSRKLSIVLCVIAALAACGSPTTIKAVADNPVAYDGKTVTVTGVVKDMGHGAYMVSDREGHGVYLTNVNMEGRVPPGNGETAKLTGVVDLEWAVKYNMRVFQTVFEAWAVDHNGNYPNASISWKTGDGEVIGIPNYLPGGDPIGTDGTPVAGRYPTNPFSGKAYEFGKDLFFFPDTLKVEGANRKSEEGGPFTGLSAPGGITGTIVILGYIPDHVSEYGRVQEYAIIGFGKQTKNPMHDSEPASHDGASPTTYFVLHN